MNNAITSGRLTLNILLISAIMVVLGCLIAVYPAQVLLCIEVIAGITMLAVIGMLLLVLFIGWKIDNGGEDYYG